MDILAHRLASQQIGVGERHSTPAALVAHLGAVQAQDYAGCKWALGLRLGNATEAAIEKAINEGELVRTHVLRPTWHLVAPADIRWMLALTAPRVNQANSSQYRKLGLDEATFKQSNKVIVKSLAANGFMQRAAIEQGLQAKGIATDGIRLTCMMMYAELAGHICNGPRQGKQFTYALMDERVPPAPVLKPDEALAELAKRYFTSHGPATIQDFVWWSGLTVADAKKGLEMIKVQLASEVVGGITHWFHSDINAAMGAAQGVHLLPAFDEYTVAYKNRSTMLGKAHKDKTPLEILNPVIVVDGLVAGTWRRTLKKGGVVVETMPFANFSKATTQAVAEAAQRYGEFIGMKVE